MDQIEFAQFWSLSSSCLRCCWRGLIFNFALNLQLDYRCHSIKSKDGNEWCQICAPLKLITIASRRRWTQQLISVSAAA